MGLYAGDNINDPFLSISRRHLLWKLGLWAGLLTPLRLFAATKPRKIRPQVGDRLVYAYGDRKGDIIKTEDIEAGGMPILAYPRDIQNDIIRDRSRLNMVLVMRLNEIDEDRPVARGLIVYSAVCTHTGCSVEGWNADNQYMICPCHGSEFEAANSARVVKGPAPKPLAILPVSIEAGQLVVSGKFSRRVGFKQN